VRRRVFISCVVCTAFAWPLAALAQQPAQLPRVGYLVAGAPEIPVNRLLRATFVEGMREFGYVEGRDYVLEERYFGADARAQVPLGEELARLPVDVLFTSDANTGGRAAVAVLPTLPVVFPVNGDPVGNGLARSLARPGGNFTGLASFSVDLARKRLELTKELMPSARRVALLTNPTNALHARTASELARAARDLALDLRTFAASGPEELDAAFAAMQAWPAEVVALLDDPVFFNQYDAVGAAATRHNLALVSGFWRIPKEGLLFAYATNNNEAWRRAGGYVARILQGAKPGDLAIEQPTKFDFTIDLRTAKALGIAIPQSVLIRADEVIE